ncbi:hypothetical protein N836_00125 [Leptolyngbya sp. Heron Island J]|uniref:hypothetical protein n=1 Tax=Leptolyngbya sp. Heron Island J TaxID=1385935 RepID=UPI0003B99B03|nr:hypothetical protein [Leptolyngbya sp. Heron Island J]ESA37120.1 hypothetical protein N836_00125 [Leptolyngbya sp. Heron Island J]
MDPIVTPLIIGSVLLFLGVIALMTYEMAEEDAQDVTDSFQDSIQDDTELTDEDKEIASEKLRQFIEVEKKGDKKYETRSGVFNKDTGKVLDGRKRTSEDIDDELDRIAKSRKPKVLSN